MSAIENDYSGFKRLEFAMVVRGTIQIVLHGSFIYIYLKLLIKQQFNVLNLYIS